LLKKLRCILSLPNLFPSLARRSVSLRTLWAYGFDSAAPRAPEKLRLVRKKNILFPFNMADMIPKKPYSKID